MENYDNYFASVKVRNEIDKIKSELIEKQPTLDWLLQYAAFTKFVANNLEARLYKSLDLFDEAISYWKQSDEVSEIEIAMLDALRSDSNALAKAEGMDIQRRQQAKMGGRGRMARYQPLKDLAKKLASETNFKSRRNAAKTISPEIMAEGKKIGIILSEDQAEQTIAGWLKDMGLPAKI